MKTGITVTLDEKEYLRLREIEKNEKMVRVLFVHEYPYHVQRYTTYKNIEEVTRDRMEDLEVAEARANAYRRLQASFFKRLAFLFTGRA